MILVEENFHTIQPHQRSCPQWAGFTEQFGAGRRNALLTLYDPADKVYATTEVPADIEEALENADQKLRFRVALADLTRPKLCEHFSKVFSKVFVVT